MPSPSNAIPGGRNINAEATLKRFDSQMVAFWSPFATWFVAFHHKYWTIFDGPSGASWVISLLIVSLNMLIAFSCASPAVCPFRSDIAMLSGGYRYNFATSSDSGLETLVVS